MKPPITSKTYSKLFFQSTSTDNLLAEFCEFKPFIVQFIFSILRIIVQNAYIYERNQPTNLLKKKNPFNKPWQVVSSVTGIIGWFLNIAKDSLSLWIALLLTILYLLYSFTEYFTPYKFGGLIPVVKKFFKYGTIAVTGFLLIYCFIYLIAPTLAQTNTTIQYIYNSQNQNEVKGEKRDITKTPNRIKTWNEIIDGKDSCNATPLMVKDIHGITENDAREFLSKLPHLDNRQRQVNRKNRDVPYLYWHTWKERETWNKDEEYLQKVNGKDGSYNQRMRTGEQNAKSYASSFYKQVLGGYQKLAFNSFNISVDSPYIVLYHEFESPKKNIRYEKRFKTFQTRGYHIFIFRQKSLDSILNRNL